MIGVIYIIISLVGKLGSWEKSQGHFFVGFFPTIKEG
jgi:hypothetical protein